MASIECFIRMARVTRLKTIAEHVETDTVLTLLAGLGVDYAQGYAINRPQPVQIA
jgi:EAL domain-containing protein (putative c-di-GMP-specific phosphodiesterase class I)